MEGRPDFRGVNIAGPADGLEHVAELVRLGKSATFFLERGEVSPAIQPRQRYLTGLTIKTTDGLVVIDVEDDTVIFSGSAERLEFVAQHISMLYDPPIPPWYTLKNRSKHSHVEYYSDHYFLAPESVPLIVSVTDNDWRLLPLS